MLPNLALKDQGAPPLAARGARPVGDVVRIHRGTGGYRSANAARPARRGRRPRVGSATTGGALNRGAAPSASIVERRADGIKSAPRR